MISDEDFTPEQRKVTNIVNSNALATIIKKILEDWTNNNKIVSKESFKKELRLALYKYPISNYQNSSTAYDNNVLFAAVLDNWIGISHNIVNNINETRMDAMYKSYNTIITETNEKQKIKNINTVTAELALYLETQINNVYNGIRKIEKQCKTPIELRRLDKIIEKMTEYGHIQASSLENMAVVYQTIFDDLKIPIEIINSQQKNPLYTEEELKDLIEQFIKDKSQKKKRSPNNTTVSKLQLYILNNIAELKRRNYLEKIFKSELITDPNLKRHIIIVSNQPDNIEIDKEVLELYRVKQSIEACYNSLSKHYMPQKEENSAPFKNVINLLSDIGAQNLNDKEIRAKVESIVRMQEIKEEEEQEEEQRKQEEQRRQEEQEQEREYEEEVQRLENEEQERRGEGHNQEMNNQEPGTLTFIKSISAYVKDFLAECTLTDKIIASLSILTILVCLIIIITSYATNTPTTMPAILT
ncbi:hypothetical protein NEOKW01_0054 [Nematocida sp. AWRm80]|nr:hypothetical protein NEOKW01_0054 [Nematocida sp. AWRm80]